MKKSRDKEAGVMFHQVDLSHDEIILQLIDTVNNLTLKEVADQFLASLSTRRLDLRSGLGSYIVGRHLLKHVYSGDEAYCIYCGMDNKECEKQDLNVLSFERFKWGGVRHLDPLYIAFDLDQFSKTEKVDATHEDYEILKKIIKTINEFPHEGKLRELEKALSKVINQIKKREKYYCKF